MALVCKFTGWDLLRIDVSIHDLFTCDDQLISYVQPYRRCVDVIQIGSVSLKVKLVTDRGDGAVTAQAAEWFSNLNSCVIEANKFTKQAPVPI